MNTLDLFYNYSFKIVGDAKGELYYEIDGIKLPFDSSKINEMYKLLRKFEKITKEINVWKERIKK